MNGTQLPEGLWLMCRWQPMSLPASVLSIGQKLDTLDHGLRSVTDVQWPTFGVMNCIIYLHISSSLVFKRLRVSWISFCIKGFSELLQLTVSSQCLTVVITWWHLKYSTAVFVCAGVWRLQQWFSVHRATAAFFSHEVCTSWGKKKISLFMESGPVCRVPCSELDYCWWSQGLNPAIWLRLHLVEMSCDLSWFCLISGLAKQQAFSRHLTYATECTRCKTFSGSRWSEMKSTIFYA